MKSREELKLELIETMKEIELIKKSNSFYYWDLLQDHKKLSVALSKAQTLLWVLN